MKPLYFFCSLGFQDGCHLLILKVAQNMKYEHELNIKVVGFVLKKLLTYFAMLIVPHALHCVDSGIFVFYLI